MLRSLYTKHIDDIYSLYHISQLTQRIPETEVSKCEEYMSYSLLKQNEITPGVIIIKLGIEESYI